MRAMGSAAPGSRSPRAPPHGSASCARLFPLPVQLFHWLQSGARPLLPSERCEHWQPGAPGNPRLAPRSAAPPAGLARRPGCRRRDRGVCASPHSGRLVRLTPRAGEGVLQPPAGRRGGTSAPSLPPAGTAPPVRALPSSSGPSPACHSPALHKHSPAPSPYTPSLRRRRGRAAAGGASSRSGGGGLSSPLLPSPFPTSRPSSAARLPPATLPLPGAARLPAAQSARPPLRGTAEPAAVFISHARR